ncbi:hypothetical protein OUZ56_003899 [Daphnia magna]|uniref:Uncharacterized protein n=1 Tax=Daphnia magna TaxID=35525 RepID=A0ABQ9YN51_9CRUS|nr:hypothetical protein OUZ56_003899 [Daphnia magna]
MQQSASSSLIRNRSPILSLANIRNVEDPIETPLLFASHLRNSNIRPSFLANNDGDCPPLYMLSR